MASLGHKPRAEEAECEGQAASGVGQHTPSQVESAHAGEGELFAYKIRVLGKDAKRELGKEEDAGDETKGGVPCCKMGPITEVFVDVNAQESCKETDNA